MNRYSWPLGALFVGVLLAQGGCPPPSSTDGDGGGVDQGIPSADLFSPDRQEILPGAAGAPCQQSSDCFRLRDNPICFSKNLFNTGITLPTPGGYCSQRCQVDGDCGPNGKCFEFDLYGKYCFAGCQSASVCRHPGYACALDFQICWPESYFDCDPTKDQGNCMAQVDPDPGKPRVSGGCLREAFEDRGRCAPTCSIGVGSCGVDVVNRQTRHCIYLDTTVDLMLQPTADKWKGLICVPDGVPVLDGKPCNFFEDCFDGSQCDLWPDGDKKCHPLCVQGGMPACMAGQSCKDAIRGGPSGPGLCK